LTAKYTGKGNLFIFNGKGTFDFKVGADKREVPVTSSEVKFITNVEGRNVEAKFDSKGMIRLWGNFGTYDIGRPVIVTAKVKSNSVFDVLSGNMGVEYQSGQVNTQFRVDVKKDNVPHLNNKIVFAHDRLVFGAAVKFNLLSYTLSRYNFFTSYTERDFSIALEHYSRNKSKLELGKLIVAATYRRPGADYVLKTSFRPHKTEQLRFKVGTATNLNKDVAVKAKINNNTKLTLSGKFKYSSNLTITTGTQLNLLDPSTFFTNRTVPVPLGISVDFNYS